jgi:septum formation protein
VSTTPRLNLYSTSPRRRELLERLGIPHIVIPVDVDESITERIPAQEVVVEIAVRKLQAGLAGDSSRRTAWGLAADTLVEGPSGLLGKPEDSAAAAAMLRSLSGITHEVHTGIAVFTPLSPDSIRGSAKKGICSLVHSTKVTFRQLSEQDIAAYIRCGEWQGVAGAYRIQDRGASLVERIDGLWSTVVGLPLSPLYGILSAMSYPFG